MNCILLIGVIFCYTQGINLTPYMDLMPVDCNVRIDILNTTNRNLGFAQYSKRITIFDKMITNIEKKRYVLAHEIGHACGKDSRRGNYNNREKYANNFAYKYLNNTNRTTQKDGWT